MMRKPKNNGFTLVEVVVAVAVIAIGLAATIKTVSSSIRNTALLNERIIANWVAQNAMAVHQLNLNHDQNISVNGKENIMNTDWLWSKTLRTSDDANIQVVDVQVNKDGGDSQQIYSYVSSLYAVFDNGDEKI